MSAYESSSVVDPDDMDSMIEPMYEDDIETIISQVKPEDVQHFDNKRFVRISDEQMPEILKFIDESDQFQFDDWAIIGETKGEENDVEESIPGSSECKSDEKASAVTTDGKEPVNLFRDVDGLEQSQEQLEEEQEEEGEEEGEALANENENSMVFSMFLSNWEDQVRRIREAKRVEWEQKMKGLLHDEGSQGHNEACGDKEFIDEDGDSWILLDGNDCNTAASPSVKPSSAVSPSDLQVALVGNHESLPLARQTGFFDNWPSFNVGSKLGVVLAATGTSFCFGFLMGARAAMDSFYRLCERPLVAGVVGVTTAFAVSIQPTVLVTAVKYIILGGVLGGTAVATPVFVVGTTGVFVSAAVYHAWIVAKRGVLRAVHSPSSRPMTVPLKQIAAAKKAEQKKKVVA